MFRIIICLISTLNFLIANSALPSEEKLQKFSYNTQDRESITLQNPIKGFNKFVFFQMIPAQDKSHADKINLLIENELKQFGVLNKKDMVVKTDEGEAIDLSVFDAGVSLIYEIQNVVSIEEKN